MAQQQQEASNYVTELSVSDVLFGRGSGPNDHPGNVKFREYVAARKSAYMATSHRLTKTNLAKEILDLVSADGGRFLRKVEIAGEETDYYEVVDDHLIMEKAKQALRQNANKVRDNAMASNSTTSTNSSSIQQTLPTNADYDLEPIPFTSSGYSGPPPTRQPPPPQQLPIVYDDLTSATTLTSTATTASSTSTNSAPHPIPFSSLSSYESGASYGHATQEYSQAPAQRADVSYPPPPTAHHRHVVTNHNADSMAGLYGDQVALLQQQQQPSPSKRANKRASLTLEDLQGFNPTQVYQPRPVSQQQQRNRDVVEIDELSTSFSNMKTVQEEQSSRMMSMMASTETMGTIDNLESNPDMSITSSTLNFFNKDPHQITTHPNVAATTEARHETYMQNESNHPTLQPVHNNSGTTSISSRNNSRHGSSKSRASTRQSGESTNSSMMSFDGLFDSKNNKSSNFDGALSSVRKQVDLEYHGAIMEDSNEDPFAPVMGQSSIEVMKQVLGGDDSEQQLMPPPAQDLRQQYFQQDPK